MYKSSTTNDAEDKWVVANYKETQTVNIAVGSEVEIEVDAVPNYRSLAYSYLYDKSFRYSRSLRIKKYSSIYKQVYACRLLFYSLAYSYLCQQIVDYEDF